MEIPYNEIGISGLFAFMYRRENLRNDTVTMDRTTALSRRHAIAAIDRWNRSQPKNWRYEMFENNV